MFKVRSRRTVVFSDYVSELGAVGTCIQFIDGLEVKYSLFMGDADYNGSIIDWILFGQFHNPHEQGPD